MKIEISEETLQLIKDIYYDSRKRLYQGEGHYTYGYIDGVEAIAELILSSDEMEVLENKARQDF
jgi:hypothetical protein